MLRTVTGTGTITVQKAIENAEYKAYQMLALHEYANGDTTHVYVVTPEWEDFFVNKDASGTDKTAEAVKPYFLVEEFADDPGTYYVSFVDIANETEDKRQERMEAFAVAVEKHLATKGEDFTPTGKDVAEKDVDGNVWALIQDVPMGYYFINTNGGSAVIVNTLVPDVTVEEKNTAPTLEKKVKDERDAALTGDNQWQKDNTASIGDTVSFKSTITVGAGAVGYTLHDAMTGLTLKEITGVTLYKADASATLTLTPDTHYTLKTGSLIADHVVGADGTTKETCDFEIIFENTIFAKDGFKVTENGAESTYYIVEGDQIVVEYTATLNEEAKVGNDEANFNRTVLTYGNIAEGEPQPKTPQDETKTYTYEFDLVKTDKGNEVLEGAEFELKDALGNVINFKMSEKDGKNIYTVTADAIGTAGTTATIVAGKPTITGLGNGTYTITETKAPDGYKKLTKPVDVEIKDANKPAEITSSTSADGKTTNTLTEDTGVQIINVKKSIFPTTGGVGTTVFYLTGGAIFAIAAALLVVTLKKRQNVKV